MYTLGDIPRKSARIRTDFEAVVFEGTRLTHRDLNDRVNRLAGGLVKRGYRRGDRVAVLAANTHKYLEIYFAAGKLGMSVTPLNFRLSDAEIAYIVNDSEAVCFLLGDEYEERALGMKAELSRIRDWISLDKEMEGALYYETLLEGASAREPVVDVDEDELAILMYTGGTTGLPKGVLMTHRNIMTAVIAAALGCGFRYDDTTCFVLPLFHVSFWPALAVLLVGGKVVINRKPDLREILRLIQDEKCTHINMVPTLYTWLLEYPDLESFDLSSLRLMSYAGSPFPPEVLKRCIQKFGDRFMQAYGMTEALGASGLSPWDHVLEGERSRLLASAGKESLCADLRVVNEEGLPVPAGAVGEIAIRGKHVMKGYWKNEEQTRKAIRNGWFHSGDMGYIDEEGYLFLVDRKADMIVTGGENVYPKETEDVLYEHPAVLECAVVSAPDTRWGERVQAAVVLKAGQRATAEELIEHCKKRLAGYKCPKAIEFWQALPKTPIGKILRKDVKKRFWEGHARTIG
jgi:acyl-CoA synthetase (AMP-forming)/AMP-acid ligase II